LKQGLVNNLAVSTNRPLTTTIKRGHGRGQPLDEQSRPKKSTYQAVAIGDKGVAP
jgi:hypothetical protein